jgi:hypothetical protein
MKKLLLAGLALGLAGGCTSALEKKVETLQHQVKDLAFRNQVVGGLAWGDGYYIRLGNAYMDAKKDTKSAVIFYNWGIENLSKAAEKGKCEVRPNNKSPLLSDMCSFQTRHLAAGHYNRACAHSLLRNTDAAIKDLYWLEKHEFLTVYKFWKDKDFENVKNDKRFQRLVDKYKK